MLGLVAAVEEGFDPMAGFTCPPGPKSGWGQRGDSSCVAAPLPPPPPPPEMVGSLEIGACYQFRSSNFPGNMFRHRNFEIWNDEIANNHLFKGDSTWRVIKGLNGDKDTVSIESTNFPELHLRHRNWEFFVDPGNDKLLQADGTFKVVQDGPHIKFESVNFPDHFLRHANGRVRLSKNDPAD